MLPGVQPPALQQPQALTWPLWVAGNKWYKQHLSYRLVNWPQHLPEPAVRGAVRAAFQLWSNVSALEFWEAPATGPADIRLTFFQGDHNDGLSNAFDGPGADSLSSTCRRGTPLGGAVGGGQGSMRSPCGLAQAAPPSKEPSVSPSVKWEQSLPDFVPCGCWDGQMRFCKESALQTLQSIVFPGRTS